MNIWKKLFRVKTQASSASPQPASSPVAQAIPLKVPLPDQAPQIRSLNSPAGSKAELIATIQRLTEGWKEVSTLEKAAQAIAASKKFSLDVVKELVLDAFFSKLSTSVNENDIGSVSMRLGVAMGGSSFARWLADSVVVGRQPAQMMADYLKYGRFGMWSDAKELCAKLGIRLTEVRSSAAAPVSSIVQIQEDLYSLIREACHWGHANSWPSFETYPLIRAYS